jgi:hypothetical protein
VEVARGAGLVRGRHDLHRRDLQGGGQGDVAKGAALEDPARLFNSSLEGNVRRAIDLHEGEAFDWGAFEALVRAAVALNRSKVR